MVASDAIALDGPIGLTAISTAMLHEYVHVFQMRKLNRSPSEDPRKFELEADLLTGYYSAVRCKRMFEDNLTSAKAAIQMEKMAAVLPVYYVRLGSDAWVDPSKHGSADIRSKLFSTGFAAGREGKFGSADGKEFFLAGKGEMWLREQVDAAAR
jgi:hypothetical protein